MKIQITTGGQLATRQCTEVEDDGRREVIKYLTNKLKVDITKKDNYNNIVLFPAANNCPRKVVILIVEQYIERFGEDQLENFISRKSKAGTDALDIALNSENEKVIEVLRSYGADIEIKMDGIVKNTKKSSAKKVNSIFNEAKSEKEIP